MIRKLLLAGASVTAMVAPAAADAAPGHRAQSNSQLNTMAAELDELRSEVHDLQQRLSEQAATQNQTQSQVSAAQAQASAAQAQAAVAQEQASAAVAATPTEVAAQLAKQPKPKANWSDSTSISGRMYFNVSEVTQKVNGVKPSGEPNGVTNGTGFNIKRFYIGIDHKFDDTYSANVTTDISNAVGRTSNGDFNAFTAPTDAQLIGRGLYIKKAYLQAKYSPALIVRLGAADLPWVPYVEGQYGYRHIENTLIDRTGFGTSSDWGIHVLGEFAKGLINYQVSVVDGAGYRNVKVTRSVDVEGRVGANYKGFFAGVGGYVGRLGNDTQNATVFHTANRLNATLGYKVAKFTIGGEYFHAHDYNNNGVNYITADNADSSDGYSAYGNYNFLPKFSVFGRYDWVKPRNDVNDALRDHYFNAGVQYSPAKIVDLALVYKRERAHDGTISTTNGTIGGSDDGTYDEIGLFGQLRF